MLFCQGCVTEMGIDVYEAIRRMGRQGKIAYVHFRNVRGTPKDFREVFVDEGDGRYVPGDANLQGGGL